MSELKALARVEAQINNLDGVAVAQKSGADVAVASSVSKIRSIATVTAEDKVQLREGGGVSVAPPTALKIAIQGVKDAVVNGHGLWTWQHMQARIPELNKGKVTQGSEAKALKKQIQVAYKEALNIGKEIEKVTKQANPAVTAHIKVGSFKEYAEELQKRGAILAREFSPAGKNWDIVALVAKIDDKFMLMDRDAMQKQIEARVKNHIETHGKLPTRQKVIEMAAQQASYLNMPETGVAADDGDIVNLSLTDLSSDSVGYKDFPSPKMRDVVEAKAREAVAAGGDFKDAMSLIYMDHDIMYPLHEARLEEMFSQIDAAPTAPGEHPRQKMAMKVKNLMPGSRFYEYLSKNQSGPKLNGEAVDAYQRALFVNLRDHGNTMSIVDIAKSAYACAQKVQSENLGPKDSVAYQMAASVFTPELKKQLANKGEINWIGVADDAGVKEILDDLKTVTQQEVIDGYGATFLVDANRSVFTFHFENDKSITNANGSDAERAELAKLGVRTIVDHDPVATQTLSLVLGQTGIGSKPNLILSKLYHEDLDQNMAIIRDAGTDDKGPEVRDQKLNYIVTMTSPDTLAVTYDFLSKADQMMVGGNLLPVNRDHKYAGDVTSVNCAVHQMASVELKIADLKQGIVNPKPIGKPMIEMHIKPDWGKIAQERKESEFRMELMGKPQAQTAAYHELAFSMGNDFEKALQVGQERIPGWAALNQIAPGRVSIADNQETLIQAQFSAQSIAKLKSEIEKLSSPSDAVGGSIDPKFNLPNQYLEDLGRQKNEFQGRDGKMKTAENMEQTIAMLDKFAGNENAAKALACACNQGLIGTLMTEHNNTAVPGAKLALGIKPENASRTYQLRRLPNGNVSLRMEAFNPMSSVGISTPNDFKNFAQRSWPSGVTANKDQFDFKCVVDIELDQGQLLRGKLNVVGTPIFDYAFNLRPDWNNVLL